VLDRAADISVPAQTGRRSGREAGRARGIARGGFSLLELVIVLAVTLILTSLMLPALSGVRRNVYKVISASHLRQIGMGMTMYVRDYPENLPYSELLRQGLPLELMAAHIGDGRPEAWDGLGLLFSEGYLEAPEIFYCPGHEGDHTYDVYQDCWRDDFDGDRRIYTNYHYCGDLDWETFKRRSLDEGESLVLATDGLRTRADLNHKSGLNILRGDGSVRWYQFSGPLYAAIPNDPEGDQTEYADLWRRLENLRP
jgi:prepilin-type N-terminal cleavage/methylation domain-containing protein